MSRGDRHAEFERLQAIVDSEPYQELLQERYSIEEVLNEANGVVYELQITLAGVMNQLQAMHEQVQSPASNSTTS